MDPPPKKSVSSPSINLSLSIFYLLKSAGPFKLVLAIPLTLQHAHMYVYAYIDCRVACGVMATVLRNGHGDPSSNPRRVCLHFTLH